MNRERGYTLIETLAALALLLTLSASGMYGWRSWQQQQRLWQTASQVRDFLVLLRDDASWHGRERLVSAGHSAAGWCLTAQEDDCAAPSPFTLRPLWPEVRLVKVTPGLGFYGLRGSAWAGHIRLQSAGGGWDIIVSHWGRIRLCRSEEAATCSQGKEVFH